MKKKDNTEGRRLKSFFNVINSSVSVLVLGVLIGLLIGLLIGTTIPTEKGIREIFERAKAVETIRYECDKHFCATVCGEGKTKEATKDGFGQWDCSCYETKK